jgi:hypothetical protein
MEYYWNNRPKKTSQTPEATDLDNPTTRKKTAFRTEYQKHRQRLIEQASAVEEGWAAELRRYLKDVHTDVDEDTDLIKFWQVRAATSS